MAKKEEAPVEVRIELPLPTDIAQTLIKIIGLTYPGTMIADGRAEWQTDRRLVLQIPHKERHKSVKARKKYEEIKAYADGWVGQLADLGPHGVSMEPHEILVKHWCFLAQQSFSTSPIETNYLETEVYDKGERQWYVFYVAKGKTRTPHALRQDADKRVAELEAQLAEAGVKKCRYCQRVATAGFVEMDGGKWRCKSGDACQRRRREKEKQ